MTQVEAAYGWPCTKLRHPLHPTVFKQAEQQKAENDHQMPQCEVIFSLSVMKGWCWNPSTCGACEFGQSRRSSERPCQRDSIESLFVLWRFSFIFLGSLLEGCDLPGSVWPSQRNGAGGQNALNLVISCYIRATRFPLLIQAPRASAVHFSASHTSPFPTQVHSPEFGWWTTASERGSIFLKLGIFTARSSQQESLTALCLFRQMFWQRGAQVLQKIEAMASEAQASSSVKN